MDARPNLDHLSPDHKIEGGALCVLISQIRILTKNIV